MAISAPFNVQRGGASTSPIVLIDAKARAAVPNWTVASLHQKAQAVFDAFVQVFREKHWRYAAGDFPGLRTTDILLGQQTMQQLEAQFRVSPTMDCGKIRNLLAVSFRALLPVTLADARISGYFMTRRLGSRPPGVQGEFQCIDRNVYGNVRTSKTAYQMENRCLFLDHYAIQVNETGLIYDACLVAVYSHMDHVVEMKLKKSPADPEVLIPLDPPRPGGPPVPRFRAMRGELPTGFSVGYMLESGALPR